MNKFMRAALEEAYKSRCKQRHGCVIAHRGQIISKGFNVKKFCPETDSSDWRASAVHAEEVAIGKLGTIPRGARLYVARISPSGAVSNSAPCSRCFGLITRSGIRSLVWT